MVMPPRIICPCCAADFAMVYDLQQHLFSPRHRGGQDILDKIAELKFNLAEAERAIVIYRQLAREKANV
jgi:hypothetical protein